MSGIDKIIDDILRREGGFINDSVDRGGATNFGVTQSTLEAWRGHGVTAEDVRDMLRSEAADIYAAEYVKPFLFAQDAQPILEHLVDCGVNHGIHGALKLLQKALGVTPDGQFGPASLAAYNAADKALLRFRLIAQRALCYARIVKKDPTQSRFIEGWMVRCMEFLTGAHP